jgi:hypothetical protein
MSLTGGDEMLRRSEEANPMDPTPEGFNGSPAKMMKKTTKKSTGKAKDDGPKKQEKMFKPGEDFDAYERRIRALLKLRTGLIKEVRRVKGDLESMFLDAILVFEDKTDLRIKKISVTRNNDSDACEVNFEMGF